MRENWDVMLIDGDRLFGAALAALLDGGPFRIRAETANHAEAVAQLRTGRHPDLILISLSQAAVQGEETGDLRQIRALSHGARMVVLAPQMTAGVMRAALVAGADGCLHKGMSCDALKRALHLVMLGEAVFPSEVADLLVAPSIEAGRGEALGENGDAELSRREMEILHCLLAGQSNKAIARNLNITESTVKMHFKNVMRKIRAQNRTQAAVWAIQHGMSTTLNA